MLFLPTSQEEENASDITSPVVAMTLGVTSSHIIYTCTLSPQSLEVLETQIRFWSWFMVQVTRAGRDIEGGFHWKSSLTTNRLCTLICGKLKFGTNCLENACRLILLNILSTKKAALITVDQILMEGSAARLCNVSCNMTRNVGCDGFMCKYNHGPLDNQQNGFSGRR